MVDTSLNQGLIEAGQELIRRLDKEGLGPDAAFWLYSSESGTWRLYIAQSKVGRSGPKVIYRQIQKLLKAQHDESDHIELSDIGLMPSDSPFITTLRRAVQTAPGIAGVRFKNNVINGNLIEDAYIYRIA
ncbi:MAG TPA: hypothetical protein VFG91_01065 [Woeseiaceae bacterium]|nr:hypothetical protein [Woeseiaceae bacterium]